VSIARWDLKEATGKTLVVDRLILEGRMNVSGQLGQIRAEEKPLKRLGKSRAPSRPPG
jgi:hypothetical protein